MHPGYVCVRTLLTASLLLAIACSGSSGGQDQNKGSDAGAGFQCPTTGTGAVVCIDAATQIDSSTDSSTTTGADAGGDADNDATGGQ